MSTDVCALCGFGTLGNFYVQIPGEAAVIHSVSCGPVLFGQTQISAPTHRHLPDGSIVRENDR